MAIRLVIPMEAAPGKRAELVDTFRALSPDVRKEKGCQGYELYQSTERPDQMVLLELWSSEEDLANHSEMNRQRGLNLGPLRTGPSAAERYTV